MAFPRFADGDVEIRFTETDESYVLHSYVLALHSTWFKAGLSGRWSQGDAPSTNSRRIYELRFEMGSSNGSLVRNNSVGDGTVMVHGFDREYAPGTPNAAKELHNHRISIVKAHQAMLGALYHVPPCFGPNWNAAAMVFVESLASTADYYGCSALVRTHTHSHLREHTHEVLTRCATDPYASLKLGVHAEAAWVVKDAATYIICQNGKSWEKNSALYKGKVGGLEDLLREKREVFLHQLRDTMLNLFCMGPINSNAEQLTMDIFRQWVSEQSKAQGSFSKAGYGSMYRDLADGEPFVLDSIVIRDHGGGIGNAIYGPVYGQVQLMKSEWSDISTKASQLIKPLLNDVTMRQAKPSPTSNLRFITIEDDELPWNQKK